MLISSSCRSNPVLTGFQVFSRVFVTWAVVEAFEEAKAARGLPLLLLAWSVTEVIRYSYYALGLFNSCPTFLTWLRYTLFIVLYPMGVTGELWCSISCLGRIGRERPLSVAMPNRWNVTFDSYVVMVLILLSYIPIFPQLYLHMFAQRRKVIGGVKKD